MLQRVESHPGLVILATNFKDNIDDAFMRRFQSVCYFQIPSPKERLLLWNQNLPEKLKIHPAISMEEIAERFELSGSNIINIIQSCSLQVLNLNTETLTADILMQGIRKEVVKDGRIF